MERFAVYRPYVLQGIALNTVDRSDVLGFCLVLTNMHTRWHLLKDNDLNVYGRFINRLYLIGNDTIRKLSLAHCGTRRSDNDVYTCNFMSILIQRHRVLIFELYM